MDAEETKVSGDTILGLKKADSEEE